MLSYMKLPNLQYSKDELLQIMDEYKDYWSKMELDKHLSIREDGDSSWWQLRPQVYEHKLKHDARVKKILNQLPEGIRISNAMFVCFPQGIGLGPHLDTVRQCVLHIALSEDPEPIELWNGPKPEGEIVERVYYNHPTLINVRNWHGVPYTKKDRYTFQVSILTPWEDVLKQYGWDDTTGVVGGL